MTRRMIPGAAVVAAMALSTGGAGATSPDPAGTSTAFASTLMPYTLTLPPGWVVLPPFAGDVRDTFEGHGLIGSVNSRGQAPTGQTVRERVELVRAEALAQGCASDPADDEATTLGGAPAILWSNTCTDSHEAIVATIHRGAGYGVGVFGPPGEEARVRAVLDALAGSLAFTDGPDESPGPGDLAAIEASLQGTWQTEWAPIELANAAIRAAGLDPVGGDPAWTEWTSTAETIRFGVRFEDGNLTQFGSIDGEPLEIGWRGRYQVIDGDTLEATELGVFGDPIVYGFSLRDGLLVIDVVSDPSPIDMVPQTAIYETLPFTKVP